MHAQGQYYACLTQNGGVSATKYKIAFAGVHFMWNKGQHANLCYAENRSILFVSIREGDSDPL